MDHHLNRKRGAAALALMMLAATASSSWAACCYFSALEKDVNQPGQKAFLTWDPAKGEESFTVQPKFEGDARDFGMVVPTPSQPTLDEMPRDFFKHLAVYTILLPMPKRIWPANPIPPAPAGMRRVMKSAGGGMPMMVTEAELGVTVLEAGVVGSLDYKVIEATNSTGLFEWLKLNGYSYSGDEETLEFYIRKKWFFTVMKIDTKQMKKGPDGRFLGEVTPTRFTFSSKKLVYPLRITRISVKDRTEAVFYVQAPDQMDLKGDWSWLHSYRTMWLNSGTVCISQKRMTKEERQELGDRQGWLYKKKREIPRYDTTKLEWAHRIDASDAKVLLDPKKHWAQFDFLDLPEGARVVSWEEFEEEGLEEWGRRFGDKKAGSLSRLTSSGVDDSWAKNRMKSMKNSYGPGKGSIVRQEESEGVVWYFFKGREAPAEDVGNLNQLKGHLKPGMFVTKFRKSFLRSEMTQDLEIVPARKEMRTEYLRILPQSPP
jgi:hypothetical protein